MTTHFSRWVRSGSSSLASLASVATVGVTACTGGVCTVAAQTGAGLLSAAASSGASLTSLSGLTTLSGAPDSFGAAGGASVSGGAPGSGLPFWMQCLVVLLVASVLWTVYSLHGKPRQALLAGFSGLVCLVADLNWFPGGAAGLSLALGFGAPLLMVSPWLDRISLSARWQRRLSWGILLGLSLASVVPFALQWGLGWTPCVDCWVERVALWSLTALAWGWMAPWRQPGVLRRGQAAVLWGVSAFGYAVSAMQVLETRHAAVSHAWAQACTSVGPSCAQAGALTLAGIPIADVTAALFAALLLLWVLWGSVRPADVA